MGGYIDKKTHGRNRRSLVALREEYRSWLDRKRDEYIIIPTRRVKYGVWFDFMIQCDQAGLDPGEVLVEFMVDYARK